MDPKVRRVQEAYEVYLDRHPNDISPKESFARTRPFAERHGDVIRILQDYPNRRK